MTCIMCGTSAICLPLPEEILTSCVQGYVKINGFSIVRVTKLFDDDVNGDMFGEILDSLVQFMRVFSAFKG
jgi:hypothetical protein